jgi:hypothetical protein
MPAESGLVDAVCKPIREEDMKLAVFKQFMTQLATCTES